MIIMHEGYYLIMILQFPQMYNVYVFLYWKAFQRNCTIIINPIMIIMHDGYYNTSVSANVQCVCIPVLKSFSKKLYNNN